jgi:hypothetical protein
MSTVPVAIIAAKRTYDAFMAVSCRDGWGRGWPCSVESGNPSWSRPYESALSDARALTGLTQLLRRLPLRPANE